MTPSIAIKKRILMREAALQKQLILWKTKYESVLKENNKLKQDKIKLKYVTSVNLIQLSLQSLMSDYNIKAYDELAKNFGRFQNRVVPKSLQSSKDHCLAVYKFINKLDKKVHLKVCRAQLQVINARRKRLQSGSRKCKGLDSWEHGAEEIYRMQIPHSIAVWNYIKSKYPLTLYGFKYVNGSANTEFVHLNKVEIQDKYNKDFKTKRHHIGFLNLGLKSADDAISKCFCQPSDISNKIISIFEKINCELRDELEPRITIKRDTSDFSLDEVIHYINTNLNTLLNVY